MKLSTKYKFLTKYEYEYETNIICLRLFT